MKKLTKKGQLITFDFSTSVILFLVFAVIIISMILLNQKTGTNELSDFEFEYVFANFEKNLQLHPDAENNDFLDGYRVKVEKLENFYISYSADSIDKLTVGMVIDAQGIGLDESAYDTCLYFTGNDGLPIEVTTNKFATGIVKSDCNQAIMNKVSPCQGYASATSLFKPILLDYGVIGDNRIVQMNIVICKI